MRPTKFPISRRDERGLFKAGESNTPWQGVTSSTALRGKA